MRDHFEPVIFIAEKEKETIAWVKSIIEKGLPLAFALDTSCRSFRQSWSECKLPKETLHHMLSYGLIN